MEHCKTCKYWIKPDSSYGEIPGVGECKRVVLFWDATEWDDDGIRTLVPEYIGRLAFVQDGSDYHAELRTMPDFGCVQHEPIESLLEE